MTYLIENSVDQKFLADNSAIVSSSSSLPKADQKLWNQFSSDEELVRAETGETGQDSLWQRVIIVDESCESQFDSLVEFARSDRLQADAIACIALTGSGFHGNRGRKWEALRGNLHFSSFSPLDLDAAKCAPALSMLPTLAVTDVIASLPGAEAIAPAWIKWVNDVFLGDGKVSGSLVSTQVDGERITSCVLGIGLNLEIAPQLGVDLRFGTATSLRELGVVASVADALERLLEAVAGRLNQLASPAGPAALFADYRDRLGGLGRFVEVCEQEGGKILARGSLLDVRPDLSLEIEGVGRIEKGRMSFVDGG